MNDEKIVRNVNKALLYFFIAVGVVGILCLAIDFLTTPFRFAADGFELGMIWLTYWSLKRFYAQYKAEEWV